jgi:hypothetical protein
MLFEQGIAARHWRTHMFPDLEKLVFENSEAKDQVERRESVTSMTF